MISMLSGKCIFHSVYHKHMIILLHIHFFPQHRTLQGNTESSLTKSATMCQSHPLSSKGRASWRSVQSGLPQHSIDGAHIITTFHKPCLTPHLQQNGILLRGLRYANLRAELAAERHHSLCSSHCCFVRSPQCTVTCGGGVQSRTVQCLLQGKPSAGCALHFKPLMSQACNTNFCPQPDKKGTVTLWQLSETEASFNQSEQS